MIINHYAYCMLPDCASARVQVVSQLEGRWKAPRTIQGPKVEEEGREICDWIPPFRLSVSKFQVWFGQIDLCNVCGSVHRSPGNPANPRSNIHSENQKNLHGAITRVYCIRSTTVAEQKYPRTEVHILVASDSESTREGCLWGPGLNIELQGRTRTPVLGSLT
jgi:hypothetical protein